jgi:D-amino peptidase
MFRVLILAILAAPAAAQQPARGLAVFISADMEGVTGAVTGEQLGPAGFEYARFREFMTREVLAAMDGARRAGATRFVVADAHGNGQNLLLELLPEDVQVVRSWPRPHGMMQGVDSSFDAVFFIGYHASAASGAGVRAHTFSSATLADVRLNGVSIPEAGLNAALAGHYGVPVALVTGDDAAVGEAKRLLGDVEEAVVKWSTGFHSARTLTPAAGQRLIAERAERALRRLRTFRPYRPATPLTLEVQFQRYRPAEVLAYLPGVTRLGSRTVRFVVRDATELSRFMQVVTNYSATLEP